MSVLFRRCSSATAVPVGSYRSKLSSDMPHLLPHEDAGYLVPDSVVLPRPESPYTAVSTTGDRF